VEKAITIGKASGEFTSKIDFLERTAGFINLADPGFINLADQRNRMTSLTMRNEWKWWLSSFVGSLLIVGLITGFKFTPVQFTIGGRIPKLTRARLFKTSHSFLL
jgi:hypothetical protein